MSNFLFKIKSFKPPLFWIFSLMVVFALGWVSFVLFFKMDALSEQKLAQNNKHLIRLSSDEMNQLQEGDLIFRRGYGFFSDLIANRVNKGIYDVTHVGILTKKDDQWHVIHALSSEVSITDGMQIQSLEEFLLYSQPKKIVVSRFKNFSIEERQKISKQANFYLEAQIPFDSYGNIQDDEAFFCTELVWKILERDLQLIQPEKETESINRRYFQLNSLYDADFFEIIIAPKK